MTELELSVMYTYDEAIEALRCALEEFAPPHKMRVRLRTLSWDKAWSELVRVALYKSGPDISEIGSTWLDSFISMSALRQFENHEISSMGGPSVFLPSSWQTKTLLGERQVWAIPWLTDTRVIYYRRDLLQQAGIVEQTAFNSLEQFTHTLNRLQEIDISTPLVIPTTQQKTTLHILASWVWEAGGHFISDNGKHILLHLPEARAGINTYFSLRRYLAPPAHNLDASETSELFRQGKAAVTISGIWTLNGIKQQDTPQEVADNLGMAVLPAISFVGGSDLVVWKQSRQAKTAINLVRYLTSPNVQKNVIASKGMLPARLEALDAPPFTTDPYYQVIRKSLKRGRGFHATYMWGLIEDKLAIAVGKLWAKLLADPEQNEEEIITQHLDPLVKELNHTLSS